MEFSESNWQAHFVVSLSMFAFPDGFVTFLKVRTKHQWILLSLASTLKCISVDLFVSCLFFFASTRPRNDFLFVSHFERKRNDLLLFFTISTIITTAITSQTLNCSHSLVTPNSSSMPNFFSFLKLFFFFFFCFSFGCSVLFYLNILFALFILFFVCFDFSLRRD